MDQRPEGSVEGTDWQQHRAGTSEVVVVVMAKVGRANAGTDGEAVSSPLSPPIPPPRTGNSLKCHIGTDLI